MGLRSGLGAQIGFATEEEYGVIKTPTRFLPFDSESLELVPGYQEYKGLKAGQMFQAKNLHIKTTEMVTGDINIPFLDQGMGMIFNVLTGQEKVEYKEVAESEEKAYEVTFEIGKTEPWGKSLTVQVGRPDITEGTSQAFTYAGIKLPGYTISVDTEGFMMLALSTMGKSQSIETELAEPTYDTDAVPFHFGQSEVLVGGEKVGSARNATFAGATPQPERFRLGSSGQTSEPIPNDYTTGDMQMTVDFENLEAHERFLEEEVVETKLKAVGAVLKAGKASMTAEVTLKATKQISSSPQVGGPDLVAEDITMKGLDDGTNVPLTIKLITSDKAL